jgi:hypothetical protein
MRKLQAGLFPEARRRIGKCLDCGEAGAAAPAGGVVGFLFCEGAWGAADAAALVIKTTTLKKSDRDRKVMRLIESSAQRIPRGG